MRLRRLGALRMAPGLDHDDRLDPGCRARRRHELARIVDGLHVQENRTGRPIEREEIEQVTEIDIDHVSKRDDSRKPDTMHRRPFDQARGDGAGLRYQSEIAGGRHARRKAGIELGARGQHAEAVGADQPEAGRPRRFLAAIGKRVGSVSETGGDDDRGRSTLFAGRFHNAGNRLRRRRDHDQIGWRRQILDGFDRLDAFDFGIAGVDEIDRSFECRRAKIAQHGATRRGVAACAHDCHRPRCKQLIETICRHLSDQTGRIRGHRVRATAAPHRRRYLRCAQELPTS